jgi:hypothetical protein
VSVFSRIQALPALGTRESPQLDFKAVLDRVKGNPTTPDYFELAKDVAAMASVYGGTLLIGACEDRSTGQLAKYKVLTEDAAEEAVKAYQQAVRDMCLPQPLIDPVTIPHDGGFIVAINIFPIPDRVVAVKVTAIPAHAFGAQAPAYVFPVRLSTHAIPFTPEQIPMLMNAAIRRIVILIESIPADERKEIAVLWEPFRRNATDVATVLATRCMFDPSPNAPPSIDLDQNALRLLCTEPQAAQVQLRIPLDDIETVWKGSDGKWRLRVSGWFELNGPRSAYVTRRRA